MSLIGSYRSHSRFLKIIFAFSLFALICMLGAFFVVQHVMRIPAALPPEPAPPAIVEETPASPAASGNSKSVQVALPPAATTSGTEEAVPAEEQGAVTQTAVLPADLQQTRVNAGLTDEVIAHIRAENASRYYYAHLTEHEQILYAELYFIMTHLAEDVLISAVDTHELEKVQNCVMNDHPEIFYISGYYSTRYTRGEETVGFSFTGRYLYDADVIASRNAAIENYIVQCLSGAPAGDDYARIKYIYEYIIAHTVYELNAPDNQNICSVMLSGASVCQGYAKAAQILLNRLGIECTLVVGTVVTPYNSGSHAWNLVKSNGQWYYLDVTWGDASFLDGDMISDNIGYDYLLTTTADIAHTHTVGSVVAMPLCDHIEDNYYVREGAYFTSVNWDQFAVLVQRRYDQGAPTVTFKCANDTVFRQMMTTLIDESAIFNYIHKAPGESLSFTRSDEQRSFTVWF